jgi:hypothetical protein
MLSRARFKHRDSGRDSIKTPRRLQADTSLLFVAKNGPSPLCRKHLPGLCRAERFWVPLFIVRTTQPRDFDPANPPVRNLWAAVACPSLLLHSRGTQYGNLCALLKSLQRDMSPATRLSVRSHVLALHFDNIHQSHSWNGVFTHDTITRSARENAPSVRATELRRGSVECERGGSR